MTPDQQRRLAAKRTNEAIRLSANLLNNLSVGVLVGGLVAPNAAGRALDPLWYVSLITASIALHLCGRIVLRNLRSED